MSILLIGVGNAYRHDDAAGLVAVRQIAQYLVEQHIDFDCLELSGEATELITAWQDSDSVILIDATESGSSPGTIHTFNTAQEVLPAALFGTSSHAFGVAAAVELARVLGSLPPHLMIYGIEGKDFTPGVGLSPQVRHAIVALSAALALVIEDRAGQVLQAAR